MKRFFSLILLAAVAVSLALTAHAAPYEIDPAHSSVSFKIRHLVSKTQGHFQKFSGTIDYNPDKPDTSKVAASIDVASVDTGVEKRDNHLRSKDFFNVEKNPTMKFETTKMMKVSKDGKHGELVGKLTLNGVTKPVVLDVEMTGKIKDPMSGKDKVGFTGTTRLNRQDFGITWNHDDQQGGTILGNDVDVTIEIEAAAKS